MKRVNVRWHDAGVCFGKYEESDYMKHKKCLFDSMGYLIEKDDLTTLIAAECNDEGDHRGLILIPTSAIISIVEQPWIGAKP